MVTKQANGTHTLATCPGYMPDHQAQGDCWNCGHIAAVHPRSERIAAPKRQPDLLEDILQSAVADAAATGIGAVELYDRAGDRTLIEVMIPGEPMWSARMRVATIKGRGMLYQPKANVASKKHIVDCLVAAMGDAEPLRDVPLEIELHTYWPKPKSKPTKEQQLVRGDWKLTRPDLDNIVKIYKDAANSVVWHDDCQVVSELVTKRLSDHPRSVFIVRLAVLT